jgi:hypothetical protein
MHSAVIPRREHLPAYANREVLGDRPGADSGVTFKWVQWVDVPPSGGVVLNGMLPGPEARSAAAGLGDDGVLDPQKVFEGAGFTTQLEGQRRGGHPRRTVHATPVSIRRTLDTA